MKKLKLIALSAVAILASCSLASCGGTNKGSDDLYICVYDGGYGTSWINSLATKYEEKTGIRVEATADSSILDRLENQLKSSPDYDIYMSHGINYQNYAASGYLANLDDLYESEVEDTNNTKFKDRLISGALENSLTEGEDGESHYYKVNYTQGAGGFVYNVDMFTKNGWNIPTTYEELKTLAKKIVDDKVEVVNGDRGETVVPFAWSGKDRQYYWDYPVFEWWYELAGEEKMNKHLEYKGDDGKYLTGYETYNPATNNKEFMEAYQMWYDLIAVNPSYSNANAYGGNLVTAQAAFANQKAAMIPYAQWAQYEIKNAVKKTDLGFDFKMMKTPKAKASSTINYNYLVGFGDSMIIPEKSQNVEKAKDFLKFMATYDACKTFVKEAEGAFLAFDYTNVDITDLRTSDPYISSVYDILTTCKNFNLTSKNPITYWNVDTIIPWINNKYYYASACSDNVNNTKDIVGAAIYEAAKQGWSTWCRNAGVKDN